MLPQYKSGMSDVERSDVRVQRGSMITARAMGLSIVSRNQYPLFGTIHCDNQVAVNNTSLLKHSFNTILFANSEHFDVLLDMWETQNLQGIHIRKIKAHRDISQISGAMERFLAMGNRCADSAAEQACAFLRYDIVQQYEQQAQELLKERKLFQDALELNLALQKVRAQAQTDTVVEVTETQQTSDKVLEAFANWHIDESMVWAPHFDTSYLHFSTYGEDIALKTLTWISNFTWPTRVLGPTGRNTGVSWVELGFSWFFSTNNIFQSVVFLLPVKCRLLFPGQITMPHITT